MFASVGASVVIVSRWLPLFPEVISCMAGLAKMPPGIFLLALIAGSVPMSLTYSAVGSIGFESPMLSIGLMIFLPVIAFSVAHYLLKIRRKASEQG